MSITEIICALRRRPRARCPITAACAAAGIIIGSWSLQVWNIRLTSIITNLAGGSVPILLIFTTIAAIILGMGMPTAGVYITLSALVIPALVNAGINLYASTFPLLLRCVLQHYASRLFSRLLLRRVLRVLIP